MSSPRVHLSALLAVLLLTAGCLSGVSGDATPSPAPTATGTPTETPTATGTTPPDHRAALNQPDLDKEVTLENLGSRSVEMHVRVVRDATNETVHDGTYTLAPGTERTVYNVSEADPDGVESFTVVVTTPDTTERVSIETSECYGDVYGEIQEDGTLYLYYAIC